MKTKLLFLIGLILIFYSDLQSQWNSDPHLTTPICTDTLDQRYPQMISDGYGGAIIAWWDDRTTVYAQRIDANGIPLWAASGIPVCTIRAGMGVGTGESPQKIISDGAGGAIIVWTDGRYDADIFAQHIDPEGNILWDSTGVSICTQDNQQYEAELIKDGSGGAIIVWRDSRSDYNDADIYAQRIGGDGTIYWMENGVPVSVADDFQLSPEITEDGIGGAIITWTDFRNIATSRLDIYAQRINASGIVQWTNNGALVCNADGDQQKSVICPTTDGGAIIAWTDQRYSSSTNTDIFAQRINSSGTPQWQANGIGVCIFEGAQYNFDMTGDNANGSFLVWEDTRVSPTFADRDIYAQHVDSSGITSWGYNGIPICTAADYQFNPEVISDGAEGVFVVWEDTRLLENQGNDKVFLQRIDSQGLPLWEYNGIAVCMANWAYPRPQLINDGLNDVIIVWEDHRTIDNYDIYVQHIDKNTFPGKPLPEITSVNDVPDDNGGKVRITWTASSVDKAGLSPQIINYGVWRKVITGAGQKYPEISQDVITLNDLLGEDYEYVANVPALQSETYNAVVNTFHDLVDESFLITAHAANPNYYIVSSAMSGQSINNSTVDVPNDLGNTPSKSELFQNYPNPFHSTTTIRFRIADYGLVLLKVYDVAGREAAILVNEEQAAGLHEVEFNTSNFRAGIYFYVLRTNTFIDSNPLIISK